MILVDAGIRNDKTVDAQILFASVLAARGHAVAIDAATLPDTLGRTQKYELARLAVDAEDVTPERLLLVAAERISDATLTDLRRRPYAGRVEVCALGRFRDRQALLHAQARLAHALGREPKMLDLARLQPAGLFPDAAGPLATLPELHGPHRSPPEVLVNVPDSLFSDRNTLPQLAALDQAGRFRLTILVSSNTRERIGESRFAGLRVYGYSEFAPIQLAAATDVAVFFGRGVAGERMAALALNLMRAGGVVIDGTEEQAFAAAGAPVLQGPRDLGNLLDYLTASVLDNRAILGREAAESAWIAPFRLERIEAELGLEPPVPSQRPDVPGRTLFVPTNGVGLGHARRCLLIAAETRAQDRVSFAAFPSCVRMVAEAGFDAMPLVQRSDTHPEVFANDVLNYLRLSRRLAPGDQLVFDGGYVFDAIYRTILEKRLRAVWIRRGLWRSTQAVRVQLDRERVFDRIVVPQEAFAELNAELSHNPLLRHVGPVVDHSQSGAAEREDRRAAILARYGRDGARIVVSMLGGGVAADRNAQLQALSALMEPRDDCLHLIVVWPGAQVAAALFGWRNTRVVRTRHALQIAEIADFVVSAVGYNSFHEMMYNRIPAIFIPQIAVYLDDQEQRARAAADRGLAELVLADELLMLERKLRGFLDGGAADTLRAALAAADLPDPGNAAAARIVEEGMDR